MEPLKLGFIKIIGLARNAVVPDVKPLNKKHGLSAFGLTTHNRKNHLLRKYLSILCFFCEEMQR